MQELPKRFSVAPYQYRPHLPPRVMRRNPVQPLIWGAVLIFVPMFWLMAIVWFTRVVF
ncbi:hypothetical protein [Tropicibacter alexandrii]|uniref:hypothetical protein n=1 Tax=Tropicibacter alexandrii TaxID=2267683 RepID=UPI0013E8A1FD|nr:hypothetical protein [Tropicibacter alexandrii]